MKKKKESRKILFLNDTIIPIGGAEKYLFSLKKLLEDNGHEVRIIGSKGGLSLADSFFSRWYSFKYYDIVYQAINSFQPDIIHIHGITRVVSPSPLVAAAKLNKPIVQTVHDYYDICPKLWMIDDKNNIVEDHNSTIDCLLHHLPQKNILYSSFKDMKIKFHKKYFDKYVNHFICPSKDLTGRYIKKHSAKKVTYLPNFADDSIFKYSPIKNFNNLLFIGRLSKEKGVDILIQAFALASNHIPNLQLTILGDGPEKKEILQQLTQLKLKDKISILGNIRHEETYKFFNASTVIIIPSKWLETGPLVAIEALASGRPIIGADAGGIKEIIQTTKRGYLFKRTDYLDLADKIIKLLSNKKEIINMSNKNDETNYRFTKDYHLNKLNEIYSKLS